VSWFPVNWKVDEKRCHASDLADRIVLNYGAIAGFVRCSSFPTARRSSELEALSLVRALTPPPRVGWRGQSDREVRGSRSQFGSARACACPEPGIERWPRRAQGRVERAPSPASGAIAGFVRCSSFPAARCSSELVALSLVRALTPPPGVGWRGQSDRAARGSRSQFGSARACAFPEPGIERWPRRAQRLEEPALKLKATCKRRPGRHSLPCVHLATMSSKRSGTPPMPYRRSTMRRAVVRREPA